jgi:hypothetical protein
MHPGQRIHDHRQLRVIDDQTWGLDEGQDQEEGADSTESGPTERVRALIHKGFRRDGLE